jgi:predicted nucleic acid-binding protein
MIILDTNVISELMRPKPSAQVATWVAQQPGIELFTTSITEAEISYGIELFGRGKRREPLLAAAEALFSEDFAGRVSPLTAMQQECSPRLGLLAGPWAGRLAMRMRK